jgi:hypothetical protein
MVIKSERLKKLESELEDLQKWKELGLVPKKDLLKHDEEIKLLIGRIDEEKERLRFMKESGDMEEFIAPKRAPQRQAYAEPQTLPDMDMGIETDVGIEMETEPFETETSFEEEGPTAGGGEEATHVEEEEEEEDPFSDKNRWKRGILEDPDSDKW